MLKLEHCRMKMLFVSVFFFGLCLGPSLTLPATAGRNPPPTPLSISKSESLSSVEFIEHQEAKPFGSYLSRNLAFPPFEKLREKVEERLKMKLKNRGEAHITVITPVEYDRVLKKHLSIEKIHQMAREQKIQETKFDVICVGEGKKSVSEKEFKTYFVVVRSRPLVEFRRKVAEEFLRAGGKKEDFDPELFDPHVTLGFTERDLHREDGVKKDQSSCLYPLKWSKL